MLILCYPNLCRQFNRKSTARFLTLYRPPKYFLQTEPKQLNHVKAVNRGDKRTRRVRDRDFVKFERSRRYRDRYRDRYRCQEKKSRRGRDRDLVFRDPPKPRMRARSLFTVPDSPPPSALCSVPEFIEKMN